MLHPCCKTLQYAEPLLALSLRGPAEPTGLPDNLGPLRELLKTTFLGPSSSLPWSQAQSWWKSQVEAGMFQSFWDYEHGNNHKASHQLPSSCNIHLDIPILGATSML